MLRIFNIKDDKTIFEEKKTPTITQRLIYKVCVIL